MQVVTLYSASRLGSEQEFQIAKQLQVRCRCLLCCGYVFIVLRCPGCLRASPGAQCVATLRIVKHVCPSLGAQLCPVRPLPRRLSNMR